MKTKRFTLLMAGMLCASASFATDYFVSVEGAGLKDGSSWENAIDFATMYGKINDYENGDVFYFQGGTYIPPKVVGILNGYSFIGGFPTTMTGTNHDLPSYPSSTPTIFSGDLSGDGIPGAGDLERVLAFRLDTDLGDESKKIYLQGLEFTNAYSVKGYTETQGALWLRTCGFAEIKNCRFYNNVSNEKMGGMAFTAEQSTVLLEDCEFKNNSAKARGGAIRLSADGSHKNKGYTTFNRCLIEGNSTTGTDTKSLGSAILITKAAEVKIVNSVIANNNCAGTDQNCAIYTNGADASFPRVIKVINSTIASNDGVQLIGASNADIRVANSIIVGDADNPTISISGAPKQMLSAGYNIIGKYSDTAADAPAWQTTDNVSEENTLATVFGANQVTDGPEKCTVAVTPELLTTAVADWGISQDLTVDMNGKARGESFVPGAIAAEPWKGDDTAVKGIELETVADGKVYNLQGVEVGSTDNLPKGIYIKNGKKVVIR